MIDIGLRSTVGLTNFNPHLLPTRRQITYRQDDDPENLVSSSVAVPPPGPPDVLLRRYESKLFSHQPPRDDSCGATATVLEMFRGF